MAKKITDLPALTVGDDGDLLPIVDVSGNVTKKLSVSGLLTRIYPVGSIYINATNSSNPSTYLGFGTWVVFGAGRVPVGIDSSDSDFDSAEETGGAKTHTLTVAQMPQHAHSVNGGWFQEAGYGNVNVGSTAGANRANVGGSTGNQGSGQAHNNLQPYIVVYMWKRTV